MALTLLINSLYSLLYNWDKINYSGAINSIRKTKKLISQYQREIPQIENKILDIIEGWEDYIEAITQRIENNAKEVQKISPLLIFDIKSNGDREFYNSNYNSAALKYYRDIEMINQYILFNQYNIDTQDPNLDALPENVKEHVLENEGVTASSELNDQILAQYNDIWKEIYSKFYPHKTAKAREILPRRLGLIAGIIFRHILGDEAIERDFILRVLQVVENRNNSIYAHGIRAISKKNCRQLKKINEKLIEDVPIDLNLKSKVFSEKTLEKLSELILKVI